MHSMPDQQARGGPRRVRARITQGKGGGRHGRRAVPVEIEVAETTDGPTPRLWRPAPLVPPLRTAVRGVQAAADHQAATRHLHRAEALEQWAGEVMAQARAQLARVQQDADRALAEARWRRERAEQLAPGADGLLLTGWAAPAGGAR